MTMGQSDRSADDRAYETERREILAGFLAGMSSAAATYRAQTEAVLADARMNSGQVEREDAEWEARFKEDADRAALAGLREELARPDKGGSNRAEAPC
ncbi:MAG: hypothetical protein KGL39_43700 [Patescibacteria group bacterium]|nr:hypothetical protein [Patescibacteria group bacterium]